MRRNGFSIAIFLVTLWFWNGCQNSGEKAGNDEPSTQKYDLNEWKDKGQKYAIMAQQQLGKNLMAAMQQGGPAYAVDFCNIEAIPITDSAAQTMKVSLKRVSDKYRNPDNKANDNEAGYIAQAKEQLNAGKTVQPAIQKKKDKFVGYYPILTNQMCMNCHGQPGEEIQEKTLAKIGELYPDDRAIGYTPHEVRGIWVVEMDVK